MTSATSQNTTDSSTPPNPNAPAVSVLMCVYKPVPEFFNAAVESVLNQTFTDFEFLIIEKPSPQSAGELLKKYDDNRIVHVVMEEPTNLVAQLNYGLHVARALWVARIDADDICKPERLEFQLNYLKLHPDIDVLGSNVILINNQGCNLGKRMYPLTHEYIAKAMRLYNPLSHPSIIFRMCKAADVGYYDSACCGKPIEDYDLWCRMLLDGSRFANLPEPLIRYRLHNESSKYTQVRSTIRGSIAIKKKYFSDRMELKSHLRIICERLLLLLPPIVVVMLFYLKEGILFNIIFKRKNK